MVWRGGWTAVLHRENVEPSKVWGIFEGGVQLLWDRVRDPGWHLSRNSKMKHFFQYLREEWVSYAEEITNTETLVWRSHLLGTREPWQTTGRCLTLAAADWEGGSKRQAGHASLQCILHVQGETLKSSWESMLECLRHRNCLKHRDPGAALGGLSTDTEKDQGLSAGHLYLKLWRKHSQAKRHRSRW